MGSNPTLSAKTYDIRSTKKIEELCVFVFAHSQSDFEVTLSGNGTNAGEASNFALEVLDILHGDGRKWRNENEERIDNEAKKLEERYE